MTTLWSLFYKNTEVGSLDHLNWTFNGAFEPLFYWEEGNLKTLTFQNSNAQRLILKVRLHQ